MKKWFDAIIDEYKELLMEREKIVNAQYPNLHKKKIVEDKLDTIEDILKVNWTKEGVRKVTQKLMDEVKVANKKEWLEENAVGLVDFEFVKMSNGWMYFIATETTTQEKYNVRADFENYKVEQEYRGAEYSRWAELSIRRNENV